MGRFLLLCSTMADDDILRKRNQARRRALRAARVVTLGLAMASPACGESYEVGDEVVADMSLPRDAGTRPRDEGPPLPDATPPPPDLGRDLGPIVVNDLGPPPADMSTCPADPWSEPIETEECCNEVGGFWDDSTEQCFIAVPGPFVPPAMTA